ncbi:MAG: hypothetical protein ACLUHG_03850 [Sutterella wadsworthensis]
MLESDHYQVEVMANLDKAPSTGGVIFVGLPKFDKFRPVRMGGRAKRGLSAADALSASGSAGSGVREYEAHPARRRVTAAEFRL